MAEQARTDLVDAAADADVMVILFSNDVFQLTVNEVWDKLVAAARPESIWYIGTTQGSIKSLDFEELEAKECTIITYRQVGVARISTETREELLKAVKRKTAQ